ncbi:zf-HC2 domain-containing protein [Streptomyces sp. ISL-100]|uniref:zf-HC2 domain-containing protein n=1 Tax=Streptomyces sp. ISL-100 TaxID=2819173 RepID=UPI001BECB6FD|nr:zf-HC2 domain-containing protein [Streptomyces sp. ISL-100]MBT2400726.1 zf-HC2 domain-containing protein [Streptomyces sp. ISL-100]
MTCDRMRDLAAELALGILPAQERAQAVAHLDRCPGCRQDIEQLTLVGDGLLGLLPGTEPPVGFETRVANRMNPERSATPRLRLRRRLRVTAAAAALAIACGFGGWAVGTSFDDAPAPSSQAQGQPVLLQAALVAGVQEVGRIYVYPGSPGWVYMSVDLEDGGGTVRCRLERSDGTTVPVGSFSLKGGYGYWGAPAPVDPATVSGAQLLATDGSVLATAKFPTRT